MSDAALRGLCAALLDLDEARAGELAARVDAMASRLPAIARLSLKGGVRAADALSVAATGHRLHALTRAQREALLARWWARPATADLVEALKVPVLLVHGATEAAPELRSRVGGPPARPDADLDVVPSPEWPSRTLADVVVIGSGAGGAMARGEQFRQA